MARPRATKSKPPKPFTAVARALLQLAPTREGFEGLVAELIEATSQGRLALMSSGDQAGVDAIEPRIGFAPRRAMQAKRYADSTALNQNHLLGEMDRAQMRFPGLDCWILASTKSVFGKEREDLQVHAEAKGWGLVLLDWTLAGGLPRLATLCAAHRDITDRYVTDAAARTELDVIAADPAFEDAVHQLRHDLQASEVGFEPARVAAAAQMDRIFSDRHAARKLAGASPTFLSQAPPISRPALDEAIRTWWTGDTSVLALLGDEGMGKTWAALGSLRALGAEPGGPLVIVIPSATAAKAADGLPAVINALVAAARHAGWSGADPDGFWRRRLAIWSADRSAEAEPRIVALVDGLDELDPFDWNTWLAPLLDDSVSGLIRIVLACRIDDWRRGARPSDLDPADVFEFAVSRFEVAERDAFLNSQGIQIEKVSKGVLEDALHPRTAFHVARLGAEIGDHTRITREQILLRDFRNRHEIKGGPLDPEAFEQVVIRMARDAEAAVLAQAPYRANSGEVVDLAVKVTGHDRGAMRRVLSELVSGGWVQRDPKSPHTLGFTDRFLPLAVGMALADAIQSLTVEQAVAEVDRLLEPWGADDLIEPVLRTCATILITRGASEALCREILRRWADLRYHNREAQDFWRRLHAFKPTLFLDMVEVGAAGSDWLGEWGVASLWEDQPDCVDLVEARLHRWLTRIGLPRHRAHADPGFERVTNQERSRQLRRLKALQRRGGEGWDGLLGVEIEPRMAPFHRAVRTIGFLPRAAFVPGLAGWAVAAAVSGRRYGFKEVAALLRDNPHDWAETTEALTRAADALTATRLGLCRTAAALLLEANGRPEDMAQALTLRPHRGGPSARATMVVSDKAVIFAPGDPVTRDLEVLASLVDFAADPALALSAPVQAELDRIVDNATPASVRKWLEGDRPLIAPVLRWAAGRGLALIGTCIEEGPVPASGNGVKTYATLARRSLPVLSATQAAVAAAHIEASEASGVIRDLNALRLLPLGFTEQLALLADQPTDDWPERADTLLKTPDDAEYLAEAHALDFAGPAAPLRARLHLISKINEHRRPDAVLINFDWAAAFAHEDAGVRRLALDLADSVGGEPAAQALMQAGWTSDGREPIEAYEGSAVLGAFSDEDLEPLVARLSGENCLRILHQRPALRDAAENRIWRWIADSLEVARTSHTMGSTFCIYTQRDEAFAQFVARNSDRVHETLARIWGDKKLRNNLVFDDGDSPGWPLLKALAPYRPDFVKTVWREAVGRERGFSFSSINTVPTELPPGAAFDDVRLGMLDEVHTDERLFDLVRLLQSKGHFAFLRDLILARLGLPRPYDKAWAMVAAGFLIPTEEADTFWREHLAEGPGPGWLEDVYQASRASYQAALATRHWYLRFGEDISEGEAWAALRLLQLTVDERYPDLMHAPPFLFENRQERVRWLNFLSPEEREARKRAKKRLSDTWLHGQRYRDVINGR